MITTVNLIFQKVEPDQIYRLGPLSIGKANQAPFCFFHVALMGLRGVPAALAGHTAKPLASGSARDLGEVRQAKCLSGSQFPLCVVG